MSGIRGNSRRLAAILAADVAGYSRLMGEDEAGTARAVGEHFAAARPIVAAHGGRVVKTMGDGLLVEFPSVVSAIECAIVVQKLMVKRNADIPETRRIIYRIGVNLGDVLIDGDDILGDGVNIAARLEGIATPGGICLSGSAYEHVRGKVDAAFVDLGDRTLKNIARPVRVFAIDVDATAPTRHGMENNQRTPTPRLSIVVLPFANIGGNPEQDYFADGVTESLTTDLSRIAGSLVIARNTAFAYKGALIDVKQIGRELNVRYVLEGSVQRSGNRLRVNAQLVDAETGNQLWAERFDKPFADLFDMQDEIVARLANTLNAQLVAAEARRSERAIHPDSMDLYFRAMAAFNRGLTFTSFVQARDLFQEAIALDPSNVEALTWLAILFALGAGNSMSDDRAALLGAAEKAAVRAHVLAPDNAAVHTALGFVYAYTDRPEAAIAEGERATALDPNHVYGLGAIALAKLYSGRLDEVEGHFNQTIRLSPRDVFLYAWYGMVGSAKFHLGKDEEALIWLRRSIEANRHYPFARWILAALLAETGRIEEARQTVQDGLAIDPKFSVRRFIATSVGNNPAFLAGRKRAVDGLRKAGLPEE